MPGKISFISALFISMTSMIQHIYNLFQEYSTLNSTDLSPGRTQLDTNRTSPYIFHSQNEIITFPQPKKTFGCGGFSKSTQPKKLLAVEVFWSRHSHKFVLAVEVFKWCHNLYRNSSLIIIDSIIRPNRTDLPSPRSQWRKY